MFRQRSASMTISLGFPEISFVLKLVSNSFIFQIGNCDAIFFFNCSVLCVGLAFERGDTQVLPSGGAWQPKAPALQVIWLGWFWWSWGISNPAFLAYSKAAALYLGRIVKCFWFPLEPQLWTESPELAARIIVLSGHPQVMGAGCHFLMPPSSF